MKAWFTIKYSEEEYETIGIFDLPASVALSWLKAHYILKPYEAIMFDGYEYFDDSIE